MASIGAYEVVHALKEGGMGEVLLARRRGPGGIDRLVAIKTIRAELSGAGPVRAMFLDEAGILVRLTHPAVAAVHDFGEDGRTLYLVMEYVAGIPFRELIDRRPPPVIAARAVADACRGVHAAHELRDLAGNVLGVVHRDISPENLMLGFDGHVKVIDFGIALVKGRHAPVTELGTIKGKPPYMSPEQVKNESIDRQSDVWSLAVVLHELLTGNNLFDGDSIYAVARAVEHGEIRPPSATASGPLPAGLDAAVMRGLSRDRAARTPTAAAFAEELEAVVQAAGGETLEAWSDRMLAIPRQTHRDWLADVVAGTAVAKVGRPTGAVTALPEAMFRTPVSQPPDAPAGSREPAPPPPRPDPGTDLDRELAPARRRPVALIVVLLLLLAAGGVAVYYVALRDPGARAPADAALADAAVVTPVADAATPAAVERDASPTGDAATPAAVDAASVADVPADAPPPGRDARTTGRTRDAAPATPRPDAARGPAADAAVAVGTALLTATAEPYAWIRIDGKDFGPTPKLRKPIPAGRHTITLIDPESGAVVAERTVDLAPGQHVTISR